MKAYTLAINGGAPAKTVPYAEGRRFDTAEEEAAVAAIRSGKLWYKQGGTRVKAVEDTISAMWGAEHAVAVSSGTAAVHTALAMCGVEPGDEVIVNPVSDWGTVAGILALQATPVFCDIDDTTYSLDPRCVEKTVTAKTRAIVLVHISGYPARVREILKIARARDLKVIEDCAQAPYAFLDGKPVGMFGDAGVFSANDSKHISCGEGGFVITDDAEMADVAFKFRDKGYVPDKARGTGDVVFLGFNYRLSELAAAVLGAQLIKLPEDIKRRRAYACKVTSGLAGIPGYTLLEPINGGQGAYWFIQGHLDPDAFKAGRKKIAEALNAEGIPLWPALAPARTLYGCTAVRNASLYAFNRTGPAAFLKGTSYEKELFPVAERITDTVMPLHCSPFYSDKDAEETVTGVRKVLDHFHK